MFRNKPSRAKGQNIRSLPTYTIPEVAAFLAINERTLLSWFEGKDPILQASGMYGTSHLLSYLDVEEAYRVYLLRGKFKFSLQFLRRSMQNARRISGSQHPLRRVNGVKECLKDLVFDSPARGARPRTVISLGKSPGQQLLREVVDLFAERIVADEFISPWRFAATDHESKPVSMNPHIMSGRLVLSGTRIPVTTVWGLKRAGVSIDEIAREYGLENDTIEKALRHFGIRKKAA